jgi:hypothetical protein
VAIHVANSGRTLGSPHPAAPIEPGSPASDAYVVGYYVLVYANTTKAQGKAGEGLGHRDGDVRHYLAFRPTCPAVSSNAR